MIFVWHNEYDYAHNQVMLVKYVTNEKYRDA